MKHNKLHCELKGVNLDRILKEIKNQTYVYDINRISHTNLSFDFDITAKKYIKKIAKKNNIKCNIFYSFGLLKFINYFYKSFGVLVGLILTILLLIFNSKFIYNIQVIGLQTVTENEVIEILNNSKIDTGYYDYNLKEIESNLLNTFSEFSLVSAIRVGNNIIINISEKTLIIEQQNSDIIAKYDGIITSIFAQQGTPQVKVGDLVKKGDIIISGNYIDASGNVHKTNAIGSAEADIWFSDSFKFLNEEIKYVKTGNKMISSSYKIFNKEFFKKTVICDYELFEEKQNSNFVFNNNFIPLILNKTTYYELKREFVINDFEKEKQKIIDKCTQNASENIPQGVIINNTKIEVNECEGGKIVNVILYANALIT